MEHKNFQLYKTQAVHRKGINESKEKYNINNQFLIHYITGNHTSKNMKLNFEMIFKSRTYYLQYISQQYHVRFQLSDNVT